ncbi:DUF1329 domain-containing protein [Pseudomonas izuensis]|uniref:DUF1329 domain-containing protein n=1 Tax=Pseudomonas izuensis TaxID=2684212 RepID=UPI00135998C2|nr:DUF1329 domain-containing protein [Pseudomonas izuensis]
MSYSIHALAAAIALSVAVTAQAQPSQQEIDQLGKNLTPWGAEVAGNKDGSIPAYTGGIKTPPATYKPSDSRPADPFADEKATFSITNANLAQYSDKLTPGTLELFKRFNDFKIDVYPTHRSYPEMAKDRVAGTLKNASNPECKTEGGGVGLRGCWFGTPFPIPKSGYEAMWNALTRDQTEYELRMESWLVDTSGNRTMTNESFQNSDYPYWDSKATPYEGGAESYYRMLNRTVAPSRDAGQKALIWYPAHFDEKDQRTWSYTTGQRRTRLAPEFSYDTPSASLSGALNYDELNLFSGRMDRFDFKLVGKKEIIVPYNQFKFLSMTPEQLLEKNFVNPQGVRWELHRVWEVQATRKEGKRHIAAQRNFYIDEDSWALVAAEAKDDAGKIFRVGYNFSFPQYLRNESGAAGTMSFCTLTYDLSKGQYILSSYINPKNGYIKQVARMPDYTFRSESMAGTGVR